MMLVIDALYNIGTWLLFNIYMATTTTLKGRDSLAYRILLALVHTNIIANPTIYFIFNRNFRVSLKLNKKYLECLESTPNNKRLIMAESR